MYGILGPVSPRGTTSREIHSYLSWGNTGVPHRVSAYSALSACAIRLTALGCMNIVCIALTSHRLPPRRPRAPRVGPHSTVPRGAVLASVVPQHYKPAAWPA